MMTAIALSLAALSSTSECPVAEATGFVGARYDDHTRRSVEAIAGDRRVRWIMADSAITQDWVPARLNMEVGKDGLVTKAWCG